MIIERSKLVEVKMSETKVGEVFSFNNGEDIFMRTPEVYCEYDHCFNCVNLSTGDLDFIEPNNIVRKESAKLVIE